MLIIHFVSLLIFFLSILSLFDRQRHSENRRGRAKKTRLTFGFALNNFGSPDVLFSHIFLQGCFGFLSRTFTKSQSFESELPGVNSREKEDVVKNIYSVKW